MTDTEQDGALLAGEFEIEPQADFAPKFKIGYHTVIIPKENW